MALRPRISLNQKIPHKPLMNTSHKRVRILKYRCVEGYYHFTRYNDYFHTQT